MIDTLRRMSIPVHRRPYDAFLSHAHADQAFVDRLYELLTEKAGLSIWYDAIQMTGGDSIREKLQRGIEQCRGILVVGSPEAIDSNWVRHELDIAQVERNDSRDFTVIPVRVGDAPIDRAVKGLSWIPITPGDLGGAAVVEILKSFYPGESLKDPATSRDVYVSGSWDDDEEKSGRAVCSALDASGFRLVGDAKDQPTFDLNRIKDLMSSCGAFVAIVPFRGETDATASDRPYKYFLSEIDLAESLDLPRLVVVDPRIGRSDGDDAGWLRMETSATECTDDVERRISKLWSEWRQPAKPHYIFYALDVDSTSAPRRSAERQLLERVTGMQTITGPDVVAAPLQDSIMARIAGAQLVIADLTEYQGDEPVVAEARRFNLDVSIEAGIAYYAGRNPQLIARGDMRSPPFMLRLNQMTPYRDDAERIAVVHDIARKHRRRVINAEL